MATHKALSLTTLTTSLNRNRNKPNSPVSTVPKKDIIILLPYFGVQSDQISKRLKSCVDNFCSLVNLKIIFQSTRRIKSFFPYKDHLNRSQKSGYWDCSDFYRGKTKRRLHDRKTEHFRALTKNDPASAIADHIKASVGFCRGSEVYYGSLVFPTQRKLIFPRMQCGQVPACCLLGWRCWQKKSYLGSCLTFLAELCMRVGRRRVVF